MFDDIVVVIVLAVDKRENFAAYEAAGKRLTGAARDEIIAAATGSAAGQATKTSAKKVPRR